MNNLLFCVLFMTIRSHLMLNVEYFMLYFARFVVCRWMCVMKRVRNSFSSKSNPFGCSRAWHALHEIIMHRMMNGYLVKTSDSTTMYTQSNKPTIPRCECVLYIMSWSLIANKYFVWFVRSFRGFFFFVQHLHDSSPIWNVRAMHGTLSSSSI